MTTDRSSVVLLAAVKVVPFIGYDMSSEEFSAHQMGDSHVRDWNIRPHGSVAFRVVERVVNIIYSNV